MPAEYRTTPSDSSKMPPGIPYIVGNEAAERFSFYGMRTILFLFMTQSMLDVSGHPAPMDTVTGTIWTHNFMKAAYLFPIFGAILSDLVLGKYRTIMWLSVLYCAGHAVMALVDLPHLTHIEPRILLWWALAMIAVGTGGIKPCVSAHVGDQFGKHNEHLLSRVYFWFYFSINLGSTFSTILTPRLLDAYGPTVAFGVPGILMGLATITFWLGRNKFVHIPPGGFKFLRESFSGPGLRAILNLIPLYVLIAMFWCLFDQTSSRWVEQATHMNRRIFGFEINPAENQATNPIFVMLLIPLFTSVIYPMMGRLFVLTPLRKIGIGLFLTVPSFLIPAWIQLQIDGGHSPHIGWQILAYLFITAAEVMVSITSLEFSYTQAPTKMKSLVMGIYWLSVYLGNEFTVLVNEAIQTKEKAGVTLLAGANYYYFFTATMLATAIVYVIWSQFYRGQTYIQGESE
jgi:proton-dependent oligopeptide transporter, POT family